MRRDQSPQHERRHTPRATVRGNAIVHAAASVARCDIINLSMGGVLLQSTETVENRLAPGSRVIVELHVDAIDTEWIRLHGHVHRLDEKGSFCVSFQDISPQFEDVMGDQVLAALESERLPRVLVVDLHSARRAKIAAALRCSGCAVIEVRTPLDAIAAVEQSRAHIELALVSEWPAGTDGALMTYLHDAHPGIGLATISNHPRGAHGRSGYLFANQPDLERQIASLVEAITSGRRALAHSEVAATDVARQLALYRLDDDGAPGAR
jgi:CheY-like chemotaxis protein